LEKLAINSMVHVRGPLGQLEYKGNGKFTIMRKHPETGKSGPVDSLIKHVGMIAGGTGITPMFQIIKSICEDRSDFINITLISANVTESDILLRKELDTFAANNNRFKVYYTLDKPTPDWTGLSGFVSADMISKHLPSPSSDSLILMCGPKPMIDFMEKNMKALDFNEFNYFKF